MNWWRKELNVDGGIPIPDRYKKHNFQGVFDNMQVGDSVFIPNEFDASKVHSCFSKKKTEEGWRITTRKVTDEGVRGIRVWRLS